MPIELVMLTAASILSVGAMRTLPREVGPNAVVVLSWLTLAWLSWMSALWLLVGISAALAAMEIGDQTNRRTAAFIVSIAFHVGLLLVLSDQHALSLIGGAYFTLRHIHVLSDWWIHGRTRPSVVDYLRYQLFLPVLAAGPIHRFEPFLRQLRRRRNDPAELAEGAERTLIGAFQFTVLSSYVLARGSREVEAVLSSWHALPLEMLLSALDWIALYLAFAGLSSIAIGLSLMMGLRIEENFNRPWLARDLPDFWSRWHMSLTTFSQDYIFRPVSAVAGSAMIGDDRRACRDAVHRFLAWGVLLLGGLGGVAGNGNPADFVRPPARPIRWLADLDRTHFRSKLADWNGTCGFNTDRRFRMTPIARLLNRFFPRPFLRIALGLIYASMLVTIASLAGYRNSGHLVYLDVPTIEAPLLPIVD